MAAGASDPLEEMLLFSEEVDEKALIMRPQHQTTIQLPPGFTIPPGMVLVRTDAGQLVMVPQQALAHAQMQAQVHTQAQGPAAMSPRLSVPTAGPVFRLSTTQQPASVAASPVRLGLPVQAKVVQSAAPVNATSAATLPGGSILAHTTEMQENVKKCKNFLATLIKLASHNSPSPETSRNVKALVQDLLDAKIDPEEFTARLQSELKSSPQPYLVPFLKIIQSTSAQTVKRTPACQTTQIRMPVVITQTIRPQGTVGKAPTIQASKSPGGFGVQVSANQKNKLNDPGGGSSRDDDDINDVASMAGVNLEESARILATNSDLVGTQIQSCKDEPFLAAIPLHKRILEIAKKLGIADVPAEVVTFISHATQNRLKTVIEKVTMITQHRVESYKDDDWYEQSTDVRSQFKFFEQLERLEKQRKDEQEREILLKAAKSRSRQEDPEQARLKQKAKEMQQQELAQMRQRDANLTALAAIGPRKKRKLDSPGLLATGGEVHVDAQNKINYSFKTCLVNQIVVTFGGTFYSELYA
ncbi:transcription initiation factor TFIID subunit 4-like isoform X2 [Amazona aestiva]|uniref:Transcription initiation factor TFIID subunit 4-like isoform X2 n=1 Tax=Amazona aestiva TaxID=12930 RepID=A0A0Q3RB02_AMAAE|nr:transcription initiation factor TFIID subunit 4-like isoform X2 [Amazona aestiva]